MIEAVLFDYGLVLTGPADAAAWASMLAITDTSEAQFEVAYWHPRRAYDRGSLTGRDYWAAVGEHAGRELSAAQITSLIQADTDLWTQPNEPMIDWARRLQTGGIRTGILSNLGDEMTLGVTRKMPWLSAFHHRTFSHVLKLAKPEFEIYEHAARGLATTPGQILFIDDRLDNCEAGREVGMQVIQYGKHADFLAELERRNLGNLWRIGT